MPAKPAKDEQAVGAPNILGIVKEYFGCDTIPDFAVRRRVVNSKDNSQVREFDTFTVCRDFLLFNETKSTPKIEYIDNFIESFKKPMLFYQFFKKISD